MGRRREEVNFSVTEDESKIVYISRKTKLPDVQRDSSSGRAGVSFPTLSERHVRMPVQFYDVIVY